MSSPLDDAVLGRLSEMATKQFALRFPPDRWAELARGVASAALELGIADLAGWAEQLAGGRHAPDDWMAIVNHLTIPETYFFRQREALVMLENDVLPERIALRRSQNRPVRLWSAGCASGEEPYSLAILVRQRFPQLGERDVVIAGTDVNSRVLARAARGLYTEWSFRDAPPWLKEGYFHRTGTGRYEIDAGVQHLVHFARLNLATPLYPAEFGPRADFDVIFCRNVLMYFSAEWQERIVRRFHDALAPDGWLFVGPCDITAAQAAELQLTQIKPGAFQKRARTVAAPAVTPPRSQFEEEVVRTLSAEPETAAVRDAVAMAQPAPAVSPSNPPPETAPLADVDATAEAALERARSFADRGELDAALAACNEALARDTLNPDLHFLRACILQEQQRPAEAAQAFRRVLYLDERAVLAEFGLATLAERAGDTGQARRHYQNVLGLLAAHAPGEVVRRGDGLTVGRLREVVSRSSAGVSSETP